MTWPRLRRLLILCTPAFCLLLNAASAIAQPPALLHYQGRLTNTQGTPVTTPQLISFSIWSGGSATVANSGTLLYKEHVTLTPSANGVIEHMIGSGTVDQGSLKPSDYNTANPVFIQVDAGSPAVTLLPRSQVTSVGYAFVAGQAVYAPQTGTPRVNKVTDKTGGMTVIGDLLQIDGAGLVGAKVTIGGKNAPLVGTPTNTSLVCQVPEGIPMGYNPVNVIDAANSLSSAAVATINVHRLLVWVTIGANPQVIIADALTQAKVAEFILPYGIGGDSIYPRLQMAFANQGSLALIPSNQTNGIIYAIDLTANPPALVSGGSAAGAFGITGLGRPTAIAVPPDSAGLAISDVSNNRMVFVRLGQSAPPYGSGLFGTVSTNLQYLPSGFAAPRGSAFIGNNLLLVCSGNTTNPGVYAFRRKTGTFNFWYYWPIDMNNPNIQNFFNFSSGSSTLGIPFALQPTRDLTRVDVMVRNATGPVCIWARLFVAPEGFSDTWDKIAVDTKAWGTAASPDGNTVFIVDAGADMIHTYNATSTPFLLGDLEDNYFSTTTTNAFELATMEPVEGRQLAVGSNSNALIFFTRDGGTLADLGSITTNGTIRDTYEVRYQP